jgi:6-pyruvoyltetrahydropterin/6-carboxytetrahydropterin synthase
VFRVTRRYRFAASHRLHAPALSDDDNRAIYGKCNHPYGHGHNYVVEVSARGPLDRHGRAVDTAALDGLVSRVVLTPFDHHNLNTEVGCFEQVVPTSENLAVEVCRRLKDAWSDVFPGEWPKLEKVRIAETRKNIFEVGADEIE